MPVNTYFFQSEMNDTDLKQVMVTWQSMGTRELSERAWHGCVSPYAGSAVLDPATVDLLMAGYNGSVYLLFSV